MVSIKNGDRAEYEPGRGDLETYFDLGGRRGSLAAFLRWSFQGLLDCYKMALAMFQDHGHLAYR